ncbi:hypothetical protein GOV03_04150 [Candidatus Woesearchaeota archaeon]|nr:hypothetical protein [Candidatus Woesearchaeota archaeon]
MEKLPFEIKGMTTLTVPHEGKELTIRAVPFGPNHFIGLRDSIVEQGFRMATLAEVVSIVYAALCNEERSDDLTEHYCTSIEDNLYEGRWIAGDTGVLYIPDTGLYVEDNPWVHVSGNHPKKINVLMEETILEERIKQGDKKVRFVPDGYQVENLREGVRTNPAIVGLVGEEGANKLAEIKKKVKTEGECRTQIYTLLNAEHSRERFDSAEIMKEYGSLNVSPGFFHIIEGHSDRKDNGYSFGIVEY